jgi:hypothetical protein
MEQLVSTSIPLSLIPLTMAKHSSAGNGNKIKLTLNYKPILHDNNAPLPVIFLYPPDMTVGYVLHDAHRNCQTCQHQIMQLLLAGDQVHRSVQR